MSVVVDFSLRSLSGYGFVSAFVSFDVLPFITKQSSNRQYFNELRSFADKCGMSFWNKQVYFQISFVTLP